MAFFPLPKRKMHRKSAAADRLATAHDSFLYVPPRSGRTDLAVATLLPSM